MPLLAAISSGWVAWSGQRAMQLRWAHGPPIPGVGEGEQETAECRRADGARRDRRVGRRRLGPSAGRDGASGSAVVPVRGEFDERSLDQAMSRVGRATIHPVAPGNGGGKASLHNYFSIS